MYFWRTNGKFNQCFCVRSYFSAKWNEALNEHENCIQKEQHSSTHFSFFFVRTVAEYEECHCVVRFYLDFCFISYDQWTLFSFEIVVKHVYFEMKQVKKEKKSHLHYWLNSSKIVLIPSCIFYCTWSHQHSIAPFFKSWKNGESAAFGCLSGFCQEN